MQNPKWVGIVVSSPIYRADSLDLQLADTTEIDDLDCFIA